MKDLWFGVGLLAALSLSLTACDAPPAAEAPAETSLMINLTSDPMEDPHSVLMGLHLAQNVRKQGMPVTVFLNVHGVKLMRPEGKELTFRDENLLSVLQEILDGGGQVMACPHCMETEEVREDMLLEGVRVSEPALMMEQLRKNPTVFTY